jgi:PAS domain S-box-containing protein
MWTPDLLTLYVTLVLIDVSLTLMLFLYWRNYRTYPGYTSWLLSLPVYCCGLILIMFRSDLPQWASIVLGNFFLILTFVMRLDAIQRFVRSRPLDVKWCTGFLILTLIIVSYFTYVTNSIVLRAIFFAIALLVMSIIGCFQLLWSEEKETRTARITLAGIIFGIAALYVIRVIAGFASGEGSAIYYTSAFSLVYYYCLILTEIVATGLFILLNMARYQADLVRSENQVRESEEKYRGVVTWANDGIIMIRDGVFTFLNPKAVALLGGTEADFLDKPFLSCIHPREQKIVEDLYCRRMAGERVSRVYETIIVNRSGDPVDVEFNTGIMNIEGKRTDLIFIRDIRERKRSEKALEQAKKKLTLLNSVTFNDIMNDVFTLSGYITLLENDASNQHKPVDPFLAKEREMTKKITNSLRFAQAYQALGQKPAKWQEVRHIALLALSHLDTMKIHHTVTTGDLRIFADPLLEQVFLVLAENVILHGDTAKSITLRHMQDPDGSLTIVLEDNGVGIPMDRKEKIFLPEFQKTRSAGLFFVREILEITDITIRETGEHGKGARFEIHVPKGAYQTGGSQPDHE